MKNDHDWKDNSNGNSLQYDFLPPRNWNGDRIEVEQMRIIQALNNIENSEHPEGKPDWISLARQLPHELRRALLLELNAGNKITGIGSSDWPNPGSIVVNVSDRFSHASHSVSPEVHWRNLNDPHYCREELRQKFHDVEYLIIT